MTAPAPAHSAPPGRVRVRLDLAYDGAGFSGWAAQPGLRTVEGELGRALAAVVRHPVRLTVAGRTDAGVHAAAQTAHVDVDEAAWLALPGRSQRPSGRALQKRLTGVLARQAGEAARAEDDVRAVLHKVACGFGTEAGGGAGDDDGFVGDVFHGGSLGFVGWGTQCGRCARVCLARRRFKVFCPARHNRRG